MALVRLEPETLVQTLSWRTDILQSYSGKEQRVAVLSAPRERYEAEYLLVDDNAAILEEEVRELRHELFVDPVAAWTLPLRHEAVPSQNAVTGTLVTIDATYVDWAAASQAVYVEGPAGAYYTSTISAVGGTLNARELTLADSPPAGSFPAGSTRIMPTMSVLLDDRMAAGRYQVNAGRWRLSGVAAAFGTTFGTGATLTTFDGLTVLDQSPDLPSLAEEQFHADLTRHDYGAKATQEWSKDFVDIGRAHHYVAEGASGRQWWKKFLSTVRGRQIAFLLPTWRDDLLSETGSHDGTTALVVKGPPDDVVDYVGDWFASAAHKRLQLEYATGAIEYAKVTAAADTGGGTQTLTLSAPASSGALAQISFLEQCRLVDDSVAFVHASDHIEIEVRAMVVQR